MSTNKKIYIFMFIIKYFILFEIIFLIFLIGQIIMYKCWTLIFLYFLLDPTETKAACRNVLQSSVVLENLATKNSEDLSQMGVESSVVCHMTFDEECHGEMIPDEGIERTSSSHSQLPEIPVQVTVATVKGSPELCVNVPSSQVLLNNVETVELESNNYVNVNACDNSAAVPSTSDSPLLITSTQSLSTIVSNAIGEISKLNTNEALSSEENIKRAYESLIGSQALPELLAGDDEEIQLLRETQSENLGNHLFVFSLI